jgi:hypothetical protein
MSSKNELWKKFKEKIASEWDEKYDYLGASIDDIKNAKIGFAEAVSKDIKKTTKEEISKDTLNRFFNTDSLVGNPKITTLSIISQYVGYIDWDDFKQKNEIEKIIKTANPIIEEGPIVPMKITSTPKIEEPYQPKWSRLLAPLFVFVVLSVFTNNHVFLVRQLEILSFIAILCSGIYLIIKDIQHKDKT